MNTALVLICLISLIKSQTTIINVTETFYTGVPEQIPVNGEGTPLYKTVNLCYDSIGTFDQLQLTITIENNGLCVYSTPTPGFVVLQVSKCKDKFNSTCVVAQNYVWGAYPKATCSLIWNIDKSIKTLYIREIAGVASVQSSFSITYTKGKIPTNFGYSGYEPFTSENVINGVYSGLYIYWSLTNYVTVEYERLQYFYINYCEQTIEINEIDIALTVSPTTPYALVQQGGCPASRGLDCTESLCNWFNKNELGFNFLKYEKGSGTLDEGLIVWVRGAAGTTNSSDPNNFFFGASIPV